MNRLNITSLLCQPPRSTTVVATLPQRPLQLMVRRYYFISTIICLMLCLSTSSVAQEGWTIDLAGVGTFSSPRATDLNQDGVKDIVIGAGRLEFQACDSAVIALNGVDGTLLWQVAASDQIFGSAMFMDITGDQIDDVFIGGRSAELIAIDGSSGQVLWRFVSSNPESDTKWFNFYNPQFTTDQDGDGHPDLLVSNGGDVYAEPYDADRPEGYLVIISAKTGRLLHQAAMPDGGETYMSPVLITAADDRPSEVVFGTGGETIGGNLYVAALDEVLSDDLSGALLLDSSAHKGYVGPPVRVDLNQDGILDIIANAVNGRLIAFDGSHHQLLWEAAIPDTECYSSCTIGYFNQDSIPDVFVSYGRGTWPKLDWSVQMMVDGATGDIEFIDSLGFYQNTTPLAIDLNGDGLDEVVMSLNVQEISESGEKYFYNTLIVVEFKSGDIVQIAPNYEGSNLSSTPWIGDLDDDGFLDIIYCHSTNLKHTYDFDGMQLHRLVTQIPIYGDVKWGAYMGSNYDGIYKTD